VYPTQQTLVDRPDSETVLDNKLLADIG